MNDLESLKKELEDNGQRITDVNILFLDLSSTCSGYSLFSANFETKKAKALSCGAIWYNDQWTNHEKYYYMFKAISEYFNIIHKIDYCVAEAYTINVKKMMGAQVSPEMHGSVIVSLADIGVKYSTIFPQRWRSELGIKPIITIEKGKKSRDYKTPTKDKVLEYVKIPETITSNITGNERTTPSDLYDSLGIGLGFLKQTGFKHFDFTDIKFQEIAGALSASGDIQ